MNRHLGPVIAARPGLRSSATGVSNLAQAVHDRIAADRQQLSQLDVNIAGQLEIAGLLR